MAASRILPLAVPEIISYPHISYAMSVLSLAPEGVDWVFSNYVQLCMLDHGSTVEMRYFIPNADLFPFPGLFGTQHIRRDWILRYCPSFVDFVRFSIDREFYVWTFVDEYYIPGTRSYRNQSFEHSIMIHGYDDERREFHISGYLESQRYMQSTLAYDAAELGFTEMCVPENHYANNTHLLTRSANGYEFKTHWIMEQLTDYGRARPSDVRMEIFEERKECPYYWGIGVIDGLQEKLRQHMRGGTFVDHRPFFILLEHKKTMNRRIAYMADHGHFVFSDAVRDGYREIESKAQTILNLELKYLMTRENRYLTQMIERLGGLREAESQTIEQMLAQYERHDQRRKEG
ncbi:hypothetical protein J4772_19590 [Cohnella sp. LGH]|uniref:hypothetical protein n=1 Tax=Cohnella sp. LGH TaxID=1619153 RepID=UPI001ADAC5E1|nr:hypothetical protein [Cohnella sp. LGH]QTH39838.1 hypothetical protein J4772_19590 [Cohnella sp. LGH]